MRLTIPDPALVLLVGPAGAGKTTFALANFKPSEVVSSDAIRGLLTDDEGDQGSSAEAFHIVALLVNGRLKRRLMTVVDATNLRVANRKGYRQMAARYGMPAVAVAFDLAPETYHARIAARGQRPVEAEVVEDQVARMPGVLDALAQESYLAVSVLSEAELAAGVWVERVRSG